MKKLLFFLLVMAAIQAKAQVIKGSFDLKDTTLSRTIPFEITPEIKTVKYVINVYAAEGEVTVTVTDPNGKNYTNITLGALNKGPGHEPSKGQISEDNLDPKIPGTWTFKFRAEKATGNVNYLIELLKP